MPLVEIENGSLADPEVVNDNFEYLDGRITTVGSSITTLQSNIQTLNSTLNLAIDTAVAEINASLGNLPYSNYIDGLIITKSTDDTIAVSKGSCYDSTNTIVLKLTSDTTKQNTSQVASSTYYVYIVGSGTASQIIISTSSSSPTLPSGYTYYRQIGYFTTDSEGNINQIINSMLSSLIASGAITITDAFSSGASWYFVYSNGWCDQGGHRSSPGSVTFLKQFIDTNYNSTATYAYTGTRGNEGVPMIDNKTTTGMNLNVYYATWNGADWRAFGRIR